MPAVLLEYLYRISDKDSTYFEKIWLYAPIQLLLSYCLFEMIRQPNTSLVDAFIVWSMCTIGLRTVVSVFVLHDVIGNGTWFALVLLVMARVSQTMWGH
jgi:hypothetical protein